MAPTTIITATGPPIQYNFSSPIDNDYGVCTANGGVVTWKNVNIRTCLDELYYKYNKFNLKVTSFQVRHNPATAVTDAQYLVYMSGLPFSSGSSYNTRLGPTNQSCIAAVNCVTTGSTGVTTSFLSGLVSFDKPLQDIMDITIELKNSSLNALVNGYSEKSPQSTGHWSIICDIYGIE